jgi:hypothetical protein
MEIKPIRTEADYEAALKEVDRLWGAKPGTPDGDRFEVLCGKTIRTGSRKDKRFMLLPSFASNDKTNFHDAIALQMPSILYK